MKILAANDIQMVSSGAFVDEVQKGCEYLVKVFTFRTITPDIHNEFYWNDYILEPYKKNTFEEDGEIYGFTLEEWTEKDSDKRVRAEQIYADLKEVLNIGKDEGFCLTRSCSEIYTVVATEKLANNEEVAQ